MLGTKVLEERESKYNGNLKVIRSLGFGTYIQANGLTQSGGVVEDIWRPVLRKIHNSKFVIHNSLILGLGGGTAAKIIRKFWPDAKITGVDIDPIMVELGEKYLGNIDAKIVIHDAMKFIKNNKKIYDLVIVDLYNGDKFPKKFEGERFLKFTRTVLAKSGMVVFNRLYYGDKRMLAIKFEEKLKNIFLKVERFHPQINMIFVCSK